MHGSYYSLKKWFLFRRHTFFNGSRSPSKERADRKLQKLPYTLQFTCIIFNEKYYIDTYKMTGSI